jgi:hypothetical protein
LQLVLRAVVFEVEELARVEGEAAGLSAWLGGAALRVTLHVLRASRVGLLVQRPPSPEVEVVWEPCLTIASAQGRPLCRYHEGEYEGARYCSAEATEPRARLGEDKEGSARIAREVRRGQRGREAGGSDLQEVRRAPDEQEHRPRGGPVHVH